MGKIKFKMFIGVLIALCTSCNDEVVDDGHPFWEDSKLEAINNFVITIVDQDSVNLLLNDSLRESYIKKISIIYKEKKYECDYILNLNDSKNIPSIPNNTYTLKMVYYNVKDKPEVSYANMQFGAFDSRNYENESFIIDWGDGTCDTIKFTNSLKYTYPNKKPIKNTEFYLNNTKQSSQFITIVK